MPLTLSQELQLKLKLEQTFTPEVKRVFSDMLTDYRLSIVQTGSYQNASLYKEQWQAVIDNHYRRVQRAFSNVALPEDEKLDTDEMALFLFGLLDWRTSMAPNVAAAITDTNRIQMGAAIESARLAFEEEENRSPSNGELSQVATVGLRRRFLGRQSAIVTAETQAPSEFTKFASVAASESVHPTTALAGAALLLSKKKWQTVGDSKVRDIHRRAEGQVRQANEPFEVNGEFLMHPGDRTRGASANNTVNCRCSAIYTLI